jgi:hypothetical protein
MNVTPSRRHQTRIPVRIPVGIYRANRPKEAIEAEITNISLGGAFIQSSVLVELNQELLIEIRFAEGKVIPVRVVDPLDEPPTAPEKETALSRVRWTDDKTAHGFGIEFCELKPDLQDYLEKLIKYFEGLSKAGVTF